MKPVAGGHSGLSVCGKWHIIHSVKVEHPSFRAAILPSTMEDPMTQKQQPVPQKPAKDVARPDKNGLSEQQLDKVSGGTRVSLGPIVFTKHYDKSSP
jgi:hypothetical protein